MNKSIHSLSSQCEIIRLHKDDRSVTPATACIWPMKRVRQIIGSDSQNLAILQAPQHLLHNAIIHTMVNIIKRARHLREVSLPAMSCFDTITNC